MCIKFEWGVRTIKVIEVNSVSIEINRHNQFFGVRYGLVHEYSWFHRPSSHHAIALFPFAFPLTLERWENYCFLVLLQDVCTLQRLFDFERDCIKRRVFRKIRSVRVEEWTKIATRDACADDDLHYMCAGCIAHQGLRYILGPLITKTFHLQTASINIRKRLQKTRIDLYHSIDWQNTLKTQTHASECLRSYLT